MPFIILPILQTKFTTQRMYLIVQGYNVSDILRREAGLIS